MPSDRSRSSSDQRYHYKGVVTQQGRVILDRDFNALQDLASGRTEADALDVIGPCGTPDDGFAISLPQMSPPSPPPWSPPAPLSPPFLQPFDFLIGPGTMYVGGQRAVLPERQAGQAITYSYFDQPDFIQPNDPLPFGGSPPGHAGIELVYLRVFEQEVSATEDPDLFDPAIGGVDTTQRLRLMRRVQRLPVQSENCALAWVQATALWLQQNGLYLDPETMRLAPQVRLRVGFTQEQLVTDPCDPVAKGGYLGADNQLIRVQISDAGVPGDATQPAKLLWGYDNASFLYRVAAVVSNGGLLRLTPDPPDQFHIPQKGQAVEILRSATILESEPDETDPTGQRTIVRCVAEATGVVRTLAQPYGPANSSDPTKYIVLDQPLPPAYANDTNPLFLRVWRAELAFNAAGDTIELMDPTTQAPTGINVTLSVRSGEALTAGAFWMIAVRPSTPQAVYPERLLVTPQPPDGPRHWACPLAVIDWLNGNVHDCRSQFDNLVSLSKRKLGGCCEVNVSPGDLTPATTLQSIIDGAAGRAEVVTVCLAPGTYQLSQTLQLTAKHSGMVIEACSGGVTIEAAPKPTPQAFVDGLVLLTGVSRLTVRGIMFLPPPEPVAPVLSKRAFAALQNEWTIWMGSDLAGAALSDIASMIGIHAVNSTNFTVERCRFQFSPLSPLSTDIFGAGILLHGDCSGLTIRACNFDSAIPPTFNPARPALFGQAETGPAPSKAATAQEQASAKSGAAAATGSVKATGIAADHSSAASTASSSIFRAISGAPPGTLAERLRISAGRLPTGIFVPPVVARQPLVGTVGCLADVSVDLVSEEFFFGPCQLGDVCLRDNSFNNLSWAIFGWADATTTRLESNKVTQCGGGFWIELNNSVDPSDTQGSLRQLYQNDFTAAVSFQEWVIFAFLPFVYPPTSPRTRSTPAPFSLFLTNNQTETMLPIIVEGEGGAFTVLQSSSSLVILANQPVGEIGDTTTSLLISENKLRSTNNRAPTALIVVPDQPRSAVTANLIFNEAPANGDSASLHIIPNSSVNEVRHLTVVSNVFLGPTNLQSLTRPEGFAQPFNTWIPFNSNF
jgi:hypothetical protein